MQTSTLRSLFTAKQALIVGLSLFLAAFVIRLIGIGWGLPNDIRNQSLHPDEPVIWSVSQSIEPSKGHFTPGFYNYGTLYLTLERIATDVVAGYGGKPDPQDAKAMWRAIGTYHLAGRILSALAGAATAWVIFAMLRRRAGLLGSIAGGLAIALAPGFVVHSRFQTVDVFATFLLALSLLYALKLAPKPDEEPPAEPLLLRWAVLAGVFAGLSAGTKYTGVLALVALGVTCFLPRGKQGLKLFGVGVGAALVAFFIATPGCLLDSAKFWDGFTYEMAHTASGHGLVFEGTPSGFAYHIANLFFAYGPLLLLLSCVGLFRAAWRKHYWAIALLAFALVYYIVIGRAEVKFLRYVFPLLPPLAVGFGWLVDRGHTMGGPRGRGVVAVCIIALGGILGGGLMSTVQMTGWMCSEDPRDEAGRYLTAQKVGTVGLATDPWFWSATVFPDVELPRAVPFAVRDKEMHEATNPKVVRYVPANPAERIDFDTRLLTDLKPDAIVLTSFETGDLERIRNDSGLKPEVKAQVDQYQKFYERLQIDYQFDRDAIFGYGGPSVHDLMYIRPLVTIWKRRTSSTTPSSGSSTPSGSSAAPASTR